MEQLFYLVAVLACPIGMGLMMWMMMRGQRGKQNQQPMDRPPDGWQGGLRDDELGVLTPEDRLAVLRERQQRLEAELRSLQQTQTGPSRN